MIFKAVILVLTLLTVSTQSKDESKTQTAIVDQPVVKDGGIKGHVLFFFPMITKSAKITFMPVAEEMAKRGHQVTVVMPYPSSGPKIKNLREIIFHSGDFTKMTNNFSSNAWTRNENSHLETMKKYFDFFEKNLDLVNATLADKKIKEIWAPGSPKVDMVITMPIAGNEVTFYIAYKLNATMVVWSSQQNPLSLYDNAIGQPHNPAYIGNFFTTFRHPMSFFERVGNTYATYLTQWLRDYFMMYRIEDIIDYHFPEDPRTTRPSMKTLEKRTGLVLQFGHPLIMDGLRPVAPNYITVGMMNCRPPKELPTELQKFMDESGDEGVVFVSFGTVLTASEMPEEKRKLLLSVFGRLKEKVLWKWETEVMEDKPANVMLSKWLPQQDVLGHPKLKLFVSHGGQSSCQESLCHQKPMVIVPVFGDQPANGQEAEIKGYGLSVSLVDLKADDLYNAIRKVLDDSKFAYRAREHGSLLMDDINKPLDRAIWWLEYALRHPGMDHLKSPLHELPWYQLLLLDVIGFLLVVLIVVGYLIKTILKFLIRRIRRFGKAKSD